MEAARSLGCSGPQVSPSCLKPKLKMAPAVRSERFKPLEGHDSMTGAPEGKGGTASPDTMTTSRESIGETSSQPLKASGALAEGADRTKAVPPSKTKCPRSAPQSTAALSTEFGSALIPRDRAMWDQLCDATDYETGQLKGDVEIPEDPLFTYEEAVHQRNTEQDLLLCVGHAIIPAEGGGLSEMSEGILKKLRKQADEARLPELPKGLLPGGWDAFRRPWALMDCPAEKVP